MGFRQLVETLQDDRTGTHYDPIRDEYTCVAVIGGEPKVIATYTGRALRSQRILYKCPQAAFEQKIGVWDGMIHLLLDLPDPTDSNKDRDE